MSFAPHPTLLTAVALLETQSHHTWEFQSERKGRFCKPSAAFSNLSPPCLGPPKDLGPHFTVYLISLFTRGRSLLLQGPGPRGLTWGTEEAVLTATVPKSSVKSGHLPLYTPTPDLLLHLEDSRIENKCLFKAKLLSLSGEIIAKTALLFLQITQIDNFSPHQLRFKEPISW